MYNTSSNGRGMRLLFRFWNHKSHPKLFVKWFRTFPGSSSSSSSQKPHYNSSSSDKRYKREDEGRERRYGDCSDRSSSGRRGVDEDVSRRRKSRWDEGGRSNGNDSYTSSEVKKRSRSRSPVKYSSTTSQLDAKSEPIRTNKKNANNWSDSSSDEDNSKVKGTRNDDRRPYNDSGFKDERVSSSLSENNNEEFKGVGLDLGYQYGDHFSSTPPSLGIPGYPHRLEIIDVRSLMSNNNNHYAAALNGSASSPTNTGTKSAGSGIQMKLIQPVVVRMIIANNLYILDNMKNCQRKVILMIISSVSRNLPQKLLQLNQKFLQCSMWIQMKTRKKCHPSAKWEWKILEGILGFLPAYLHNSLDWSRISSLTLCLNFLEKLQPLLDLIRSARPRWDFATLFKLRKENLKNNY